MNNKYILKCTKNIVVCAAVFFLASCATNQSDVGFDTPEATDVKTGLVVRDFLVAIAQVHEPRNSTIQLNAPTARFGKELENGFRELGYGMQRVRSDQGKLFLSYSITTSENSSTVVTTSYKVAVGDVAFERSYADEPGGGIAPTGAMTVQGTRTPITLNETLFPNQSVEVVYEDDPMVEIDARAITVIDASVMSAIAELRQTDLPAYKSLNSQNQIIENLFTNGGNSNFESIDEGYRTVRKDTVIFDDDSMVLKTKGREQIAKLMSYYEPDKDVFRLLGCSVGKTNLEGGNAELALGRSARVAEELVLRDVGLESIFDEGCWSPTADGYGAGLPRRAVIIELQRKQNQ